MAKRNLQEQIQSTRYGRPETEEFEGMPEKPSPKVSGRIYQLPLDRLVEYKDETFEQVTGRPQPFRPYTPEKMQALSKSIADHGVIDPITVRPYDGDTYQIIAGRNRTRASALCGKKDIPAIIRPDIDDVTAALIMLDTNLEQRHRLSYSEKAYAYKMRLDLQNRQGRRSDLTETGERIDTLSEAGKERKESRRTVAYLIRLTYLIPELLSLVDRGKIGFKAGVELSYLKPETQRYLLETVLPTEIKLKPEAAHELRQAEESGPLSPETIRNVCTAKPKTFPASITISGKRLQEYADILSGAANIEELFLDFLKQYRRSAPQN